jgi:hypothetical protein
MFKSWVHAASAAATAAGHTRFLKSFIFMFDLA